MGKVFQGIMWMGNDFFKMENKMVDFIQDVFLVYIIFYVI